jgi:hypothetical protein
MLFYFLALLFTSE